LETPLYRWIRDQIDRDGPVPFEQFMEWALYHPEFGYYSTGQVRIGHDAGDFTTAPHIAGLFAWSVAQLLVKIDAALGYPRLLTVVEGGPGEGRLARDVLDRLSAVHPGVYARTRYVLDEVSPELTRRQAEELAPHGRKVAYQIPTEGFEGVCLSNELLDAFPVHRLVCSGSGIEEVYVASTGGGLVEELGPPSRPDLEAAYTEEGWPLPDGCAFEVNLRLRRWLGELTRRLNRGCVVTVDYGDEFRRLYGPRRPHGTCVGYRDHRLVEDLLATPGLQDLTAHVNFTALRRIGATLGLRALPLVSQRQFLFATGLVPALAQMEEECATEAERIELRRSTAPLFMPAGHGMGDTFKVLVQTRGVAMAGLWEGLPPGLA
jgi:SAM-dependent MidA family methyltransferase